MTPEYELIFWLAFLAIVLPPVLRRWVIRDDEQRTEEPTPMISQLAIFERSACACQQCRQTCRSGRPGAVAPGDIDAIAEYVGLEEASPEFIGKMFQATDDGPSAPSDRFADGATPAIRPQTRDDGTCVFLSPEGDCTIHPVAPFECSRVNACDPAAGSAAMRALGRSIIGSGDYIQLWWWLRGVDSAASA